MSVHSCIKMENKVSLLYESLPRQPSSILSAISILSPNGTGSSSPHHGEIALLDVPGD